MMWKWPSIEQPRTAFKHIKDRAQYVGLDDSGKAIYNSNAVLPVLTFEGTTKVHGTCAGIEYDTTSEKLRYYSRERVLSLSHDNCGFMLYMMQYEDRIREMMRDILAKVVDYERAAKIIVYGEWAGQGIQKGVAVSQLPKMFLPFGARFVWNDDETSWVDPIHLKHFADPELRFFPIRSFGVKSITIDFNNSVDVASSLNQMIEMTAEVEACCPVGKAFIGGIISNNSCTVSDEFSLTWQDNSIRNITSYNALEKSIMNYVSQKNLPIGTVLELGV